MYSRIEELRKRLKAAPDDQTRVDALVALGNEIRGFDADESQKHFEEALQISESSSNELGVAESRLGLGFGQLFLGEYSKALELGLEAQRRFDLLKSAQGSARARVLEAVVHRSLGNIDRALELIFSAQRDLEQGLSDPPEESELETLGWCYYGIAEAQSDLRDQDSALEYFEKGLETFRKLGSPVGESRILNGIGNVYRVRKENHRALQYLRRSLQLNREIGLNLGISRTLTDLGTCFEEAGEFEAALGHNQEALRLREQTRYRSAAITNRINIGRIRLKQGLVDEAGEILTSARDEARELGLRPKLFAIHELLAEIEERKGRFESALGYYREFHRLEREVFSEESASRIKHLQVAHQVEAAERDTEIHRLKNVELVQLNEALQERNEEIRRQKEKSEQLLLNILPSKIVDELQQSGRTRPETFCDVTVFFSDFVGFTQQSEVLSPEHLIGELNEIFTAFDEIVEQHGCERIKTIGDAYLAVCGMPEADEDHARRMARVARSAVTYLEKRNETHSIQWPVRIGMHSGPVVGGVVGVKKYIYDVFGDTINTASRMESHCDPMRINVSEATYLLLKDDFSFVERALIPVKGKGEQRMYYLQV